MTERASAAIHCIHCGTEQTHRVCGRCFVVRGELRSYLRGCFPPEPGVFEKVTDEVTDNVLRIMAGNGREAPHRERDHEQQRCDSRPAAWRTDP